MKNQKLPRRPLKIKRPGVFLLLPSVLGLLLCAAMLVGTSWAWFVNSVQIPQTFTVASFAVAAEVADEEGSFLGQTPDGGYQLCGNTTYQITLLASSTASEGYCVVRCGEQSYHTGQIYRGGALKFTITPAEDAYCSFFAMWGRHPAEPDIEDGSVLGEKRPEPSQEPAGSAESGEEATGPLEKPVEPATEPTEPVTDSTEPLEEPAESGGETVPPQEEPAETVPEETEQPAEPTEPIEPAEPTEPATAAAPAEQPDPAVETEP